MANNHNFRIKNGLEVGGVEVITANGVMLLPSTSTATTQDGGTSNTRIATTAFVQQELTTLIGGAPSTLNDLNELAAAINDDANYNTTLTTALATKLPLAGGTITGQVEFPSSVSNRPVLTGGFLSRQTSDGDADIWGISETYYPSEGTAANAWGIRWASSPNHIQFVGANANKVTFDLDNGAINSVGVITASGGNSGNWNTAYGWGNHASAGYLTSSSTQTKYLRSDTSDTMTGELNVTRNGGMTGSTAPQYSNANIEVQTSSNHAPAIGFHRGGYSATTLYEYDGELYTNAWVTRAQTGKLVSSGNIGSYAWTSSNDGSGSGLDADLLDGQHGSYYAPASSSTAGVAHGYLSLGQLTSAMDTTNLDLDVAGNASIRAGSYLYFGISSSNYGSWKTRIGSANTSTMYIHSQGIDINNTGYANPVVNWLTANASTFSHKGNTIWHAGNDGSGSGLDADFLDGYNAEETAVNNSIVKRDGGAMITAKKLYLNGGNYEGQIIFGAVDAWRTGIRQHDDADAELRIWAKNANGRIHIATGYDGQPASIVRPTDGFVVDHNNVGIGNFSATDPSQKLHVLGNILMSGGTMRASPSKGHQIGSYNNVGANESKSNPIYTIGSSYNPGDAALSNMYGIGYSYSNASFISFSGGAGWGMYVAADGDARVWLNGTAGIIASTGQHYVGSNVVWNAGNDGAGSGLDADLLDGQQGSYYAPATGGLYLPINNPTATGTLVSPIIRARKSQTQGNYTTAALWTESYSSTNTGIAFHISGNVGKMLDMRTDGHLYWENGRVWSATSDGSGSGLDADLLDGHDHTAFEPHGTLSVSSDYQYGNAASSLYTTFTRSSATTDADQHGRYYYSGTGVHRTKYIPIDKTASYRMKIRWKTSAAKPTYIAVFILDSSGNNVTGSGTYWRYPWSGTNSPTSWTTSEYVYHANELPSTAAYIAFGISHTNYGTSGATYYVSELELEKNNSVQYSAAGGVSQYYTSARTLRGYIGATETNDGHFVIATSGGEDIAFKDGGMTGTTNFLIRGDGTLLQGTSNTIWHAGNDGSGSGLDADLLDGQQGSYYAPNTSLGNYVAKNANTMTGSAFKMGFHSGSGGTTFGANHYSMGVDVANGSWSGTHYSDLIIGYHTGIRIGAAYSGIRFYSNSPTTDTDNDGEGQGTETLLMTVGGHLTGGSGVAVGGTLSAANLKVGTWSSNNQVWHAGNDGSGSTLDADLLDGQQGSYYYSSANPPPTYTKYLRSDVADSATGRITFNGNDTNNHDTIATASGSQGGLEVYNTGSGNDAFMAFHAGADYALYFGLDADTNKLAVGGWSMGAVKHAIYHEGNKPSLATLGYTGATNANYITNNNQLTNGSGYQTTSGTVAQSHYVSGSAFATTGSPGSVLEYQQASGQTDTRLAPSGDWHNTIRMGHGNPYNYYSNTIAARMTGTGPGDLYTQSIYNNAAGGWRKLWSTGNDGSGSTLDADLLDGQHGSYYYSSANPPPTDSQYLRSNAADTGSGKITLTATEGLEVGGIRGRAIGDQSGDFIQLYERVNIGYPSGWGASGANAPTQGLSTHGGAQFNVGNVSGAPLTFNGNAIWHAGNDGSGSTLDADLLDGKSHENFGATLATFGTTSGTGGRIRCTAPFNTNSGKMFQVTVSLYTSYQVRNYIVAGYMYSTSNQWYSATAIYLGPGSPDIKVGRDSSGKAYISIARGSYTGVRVHSMTRGYYTTVADTYDPWTITENDATENSLTPTTSTTWHSTNDGSGSGLDADLLDGQQGSYYTTAANLTGDFPAFVQIGDSSSYGTNSGGWGARLNVTDNVHAKIEVGQDANSMLSHWYAHTGQDSIKFGTSSAHDVEFQRAGSTKLEIADGVNLNNQNISTTGSGNYVLIGGAAANNAYSTVPSTTGLLFGGGNDPTNYSIGTSMQNIDGNYTKLNIKWHTGIRFFAMNRYGGVRFHSDVGMGTELMSIGNTDGHVRVANNLYANGGNLVWNASNDGAGSGLAADSASTIYTTQTAGTNATHYVTFVSTNSSANQGLKFDPGMMYNPSTNTLGDVNFNFKGTLIGNASTASSAPNASNLNTAYGVTAGDGYGLKFWNGSDTYKISMGNSAEYHYGPVTDYSIKTIIDSNSSTRGFTWGTNGGTPIAGLNVGNGNMQIAGTFTSTRFFTTDGTNTLSTYVSGSYNQITSTGSASGGARELRFNLGQSGTTMTIHSTQVHMAKTMLLDGATTTGTSTSNIISTANADTSSVTGYHISFTKSDGSTSLGRITTNNYATTYTTSSDYRLKEDLVEVTGATAKVLSIPTKNFRWVGSDVRTDGFLAHELAPIVPDAVVGEKDGMTAPTLYLEGEELPEGVSVGDIKVASVPDYQSVDQSKLVPLLVKTIQELEARITALENA